MVKEPEHLSSSKSREIRRVKIGVPDIFSFVVASLIVGFIIVITLLNSLFNQISNEILRFIVAFAVGSLVLGVPPAFKWAKRRKYEIEHIKRMEFLSFSENRAYPPAESGIAQTTVYDYYYERLQSHLERLFSFIAPWWKRALLLVCLAIVAVVVLEMPLSKKEMLADLDFLVETLRDVHPATLEGFTEEQERIIASVSASIEEGKMSREEFVFAINRIITSFKDAHTALAMDFDGKGINLPIVWLSDGLYIFEDKGEFKAGDQIVKIGEFTEKQLIDRLSDIISAENTYWVRYRGETIVRYRQVLQHLGVIDRDDHKVWLTVNRNGALVRVSVDCNDNLEKYSFGERRPWIGYEIYENDNLGYFWLDSCTYDKTYRRIVEEFFREVNTTGIDNVVVDLRYNAGGNSMVAFEFLKYLNISNYNVGGWIIRYSEQAQEQRGYSDTRGIRSVPSYAVSNGSSKMKFKGNVFVLISNRTCSSANMFAYILRDNRLATLVGEPTGNAPICYGDILLFKLPNSGIKFTASHKKFIRPKPQDPPADALYPDIFVKTTIDHILNGIDPQLEAVKEIIKSAKGS